MKNTDFELRRKIEQEILWAPSVAAAGIEDDCGRWDRHPYRMRGYIPAEVGSGEGNPAGGWGKGGGQQN